MRPGMIIQPSFGSDSYRRLFMRADTGSFRTVGHDELPRRVATRSTTSSRDRASWRKSRSTAGIYQDLGNGDFVSLAIHGNRNRNDFYRNLSLADIAANGYDFDNDPICRKLAPQSGTVQNESLTTPTSSSCTNYYNLRTNPSDTANIRGQSSFGLSDSLRLTIDPSFQYTLANGGGYTLTQETRPAPDWQYQRIGRRPEWRR